MGTPAQAPGRRRTQAERSATTRAAVIDAAALCIAENGFTNTTTAHIARRAGVTWGAIQHQFGDKDAILFALIENSLDELVAIVRADVPRTGTLEERSRSFVFSMWRVYQTPVFRAGLEILLGSRGETNADFRNRTGQFIKVLSDLFVESFDGLDVPPRQLFRALRFALATLAGFALEETFGGPNGEFHDQLETLNKTLLTILKPAGD